MLHCLDLTDNLYPVLALRVFAYDFLRRTFLQEPSSDYLQVMAKPDFILEFPFSHENEKIQQGIQRIAAYLKLHDVTGVETADQLHWDFTRMFVGPYQLEAPPWESAYLSVERLLFQESTLEVRRSYMKYGFMVQHYRQEADDHLGLELDYMYQLAVLACDRLGHHTTESGEVLDDSRTFLEEHLLNWTPALTKDIRRHAATPFYQGLADVLEGFLQVDQTLLGQLLNQPYTYKIPQRQLLPKNKTSETRRHEAANADTKNTKKNME